ncbi:hypothetical protein ACQP2Y_41620 [Actinoplanes sp. CA-051413]|uniref:hypothetical protein n=1 Tax=Actinoplanes sp. CA-051413 TaxID=3239899 RepID=UPI003D95E9F5
MLLRLPTMLKPIGTKAEPRRLPAHDAPLPAGAVRSLVHLQPVGAQQVSPVPA